MSFESVRAWIAENASDLEILQMSASTATVAEAAETLGVEPARIAKTRDQSQWRGVPARHAR